jgi:hypothetical protein
MHELRIHELRVHELRIPELRIHELREYMSVARIASVHECCMDCVCTMNCECIPAIHVHAIQVRAPTIQT